MYDAYLQRITECDAELERQLKSVADKGADTAAAGEPSPTTSRERRRSGPKRRRKAGSHAPQFDLGRELHRITGVDLTADRRHRCRRGPDRHQRSGRGYDPLEDRGAFRLLARAVSG